MTDQPTNHRAEAERWIAEFHESIGTTPNRQDMLRLALIHALLAQPADFNLADHPHDGIGLGAYRPPKPEPDNAPGPAEDDCPICAMPPDRHLSDCPWYGMAPRP